jgi:hypothetical protein
LNQRAVARQDDNRGCSLLKLFSRRHHRVAGATLLLLHGKVEFRARRPWYQRTSNSVSNGTLDFIRLVTDYDAN